MGEWSGGLWELRGGLRAGGWLGWCLRDREGLAGMYAVETYGMHPVKIAGNEGRDQAAMA